MLRRVCHITIILFCLAFNTAAQAQDRCSVQVYAVTDIHLDKTAATGTMAREEAILDATERAFQKVLRRLLLDNQQGQENLSTLNPADFVDFIHIDNENALAQRYIADIDICFDAARLRNVMSENNLQWSELETAPILLLPVWQDPSGIRVWTRNVLWLDSWRRLELESDSLVRTTFLTPDFVLERQLKGEFLVSEDAEKIAQAAKEAGAIQSVLLFAGLDYASTQPYLNMQAKLFNADGQPLTLIASEKLKMNGQVNMQVAFEMFQETVMDALEKNWRQANLYVANQQDEIFVTLGSRSPESWYRTKKILADLPVVSSVSVYSLNAETSVLKVQLSGPVDTLQMAVRASGYRLDPSDFGYQLRVNPN